jgi:hypothetical protein
MAIQHSRTIENLEVLNDGNNVVTEVEVRFVSYDDSDQERTTINSNQTFLLETEGVTPDSDGFVAFGSLTAETVEGWLGEKLTTKEESVQANHTSWINSVINPPAPRTVNKATPW